MNRRLNCCIIIPAFNEEKPLASIVKKCLEMRRAFIDDVKVQKGGFQGKSEFLIKAARKGFIIREVPTPSIYADEKSKINPVKDVALFIKLAIKYLIKRNG